MAATLTAAASEGLSALRISDGLVVVSEACGVHSQSEECLRLALQQRVKPLLMLDKALKPADSPAHWPEQCYLDRLARPCNIDLTALWPQIEHTMGVGDLAGLEEAYCRRDPMAHRHTRVTREHRPTAVCLESSLEPWWGQAG